jgi:hypothetical protein
MRVVLLTALLALVSVPRAQAVWLGRLDPKQVMAVLSSRLVLGSQGLPLRSHSFWVPWASLHWQGWQWLGCMRGPWGFLTEDTLRRRARPLS